MPRRHRSARDRSAPPPPRSPRSHAPDWAHVDGNQVRQVSSDEKTFICPGCDHVIHMRVRHLVVVPDDAVDDRRHWHTPCWERELKRRR